MLDMGNSCLTFFLNSVLNIISCKMKWSCGALSPHFTSHIRTQHTWYPRGSLAMSCSQEHSTLLEVILYILLDQISL